eukprot:1166906_1
MRSSSFCFDSSLLLWRDLVDMLCSSGTILINVFPRASDLFIQSLISSQYYMSFARLLSRQCAPQSYCNPLTRHIPYITCRRFAQQLQKTEYASAEDLSLLRNIGISAHIDSGKTTTTERILYYTGRINAIHEVRGKDGVGAKMDSMDLEREKGITIKSAATHTEWDYDNNNYHINIIDTPGHVDFTIEVERSLQILDGAIMIICSSSGIQSQTITVDRQCKRYNVPRVIFFNKCDRIGSRPYKVMDELKTELELNAAFVQIPIGIEEDHCGLIDIITQKAIYFDGDNGEHIRITDQIPNDYVDDVAHYRTRLVEALAECGDEEMEMHYLEETFPTDLTALKQCIRKYTISQQFLPCFVGSAYRNKGIQTLLDGVIDYLPSPLDRTHFAKDVNITDDEEKSNLVQLSTKKSDPVLFLAFKLEENQFGQLTWVRVYQGTLKKGATIQQNNGLNARASKRVRLNRLVRLHSDEMQDISTAHAGDICAMFGVDCASGSTFSNGKDLTNLVVSDLFVPECVVSLSVKPSNKQDMTAFSKAIERFQREDPTFKCSIDDRNSCCIFNGMGELHLQIYLERIEREYGVQCIVGKPRVNYKECATASYTAFDYLHKKQTGGQGQYARIIGYCEPLENIPNSDKTYEFVNRVTGNAIPSAYIKSVDAGFKECLEKGPLCGGVIEGMRVVLEDGVTHDVDSSDLAFNSAAKGAFRQLYNESGLCPKISEPFMNVEVAVPSQFEQSVIANISGNTKATITNISQSVNGKLTTVKCLNSLDSMFGYATSLRSLTQGKGEFSMEYHSHQFVDATVQNKLIEEYKEMLANQE